VEKTRGGVSGGKKNFVKEAHSRILPEKRTNREGGRKNSKRPPKGEKPSPLKIKSVGEKVGGTGEKLIRGGKKKKKTFSSAN